MFAEVYQHAPPPKLQSPQCVYHFQRRWRREYTQLANWHRGGEEVNGGGGVNRKENGGGGKEDCKQGGKRRGEGGKRGI